jgi:KaiC/GvpD/RAD55 family RecA-like ATPase
MTTELTLPRCPTGIKGLDEITFGGLPAGRPTLLCGGAGCGKTLMAMEFIVRGATEFNEPGVFMSFEEHPEELAQNVPLVRKLPEPMRKIIGDLSNTERVLPGLDLRKK